MRQQKSLPVEVHPAGIRRRPFRLRLAGPHLKEGFGGVALVEMLQQGAAEHGGVGPDVRGDGGKLIGVLQAEAQGQRQLEGLPRPAQRLFHLRRQPRARPGSAEDGDDVHIAL